MMLLYFILYQYVEECSNEKWTFVKLALLMFMGYLLKLNVHKIILLIIPVEEY